jgi:hypothetical protein
MPSPQGVQTAAAALEAWAQPSLKVPAGQAAMTAGAAASM